VRAISPLLDLCPPVRCTVELLLSLLLLIVITILINDYDRVASYNYNLNVIMQRDTINYAWKFEQREFMKRC